MVNLYDSVRKINILV